MTIISANNLSKNYQVHLKTKGLKASIKSLFHREFKNVEAVKNISFEIEQGELVGFIGPNGAGKTTTLKMLSGLLYPTSGVATVLGYTPVKRQEEYLKQISLVMGQKNQLWWDLAPIETFELQKEIYEIKNDLYEKNLEELVEMLEVKSIINQPVRQLSLGQRMKCELIAALVFQPKVLFLDEPTIGLDIVTQKKVREFIKEYNRKYQATVILTSHYMDDVKEVCDRIIMINHGQIVFDGRIDELIKKHADYKILAPVFNEAVTKEELEQFGQVHKFDYPQAILHVERAKVSQVAAQLLAKYDIDDLDINEPELEDVIAKEFERKA